MNRIPGQIVFLECNRPGLSFCAGMFEVPKDRMPTEAVMFFQNTVKNGFDTLTMPAEFVPGTEEQIAKQADMRLGDVVTQPIWRDVGEAKTLVQFYLRRATTPASRADREILMFAGLVHMEGGVTPPLLRVKELSWNPGTGELVMMDAPEDYSAGLRHVQIPSLDDVFLLPIWGFEADAFAFRGTQFDQVLAEHDRMLELEIAGGQRVLSEDEVKEGELLQATSGGKMFRARTEQFGEGTAQNWITLSMEHRGLDGLKLQGRRSSTEVEQMWRANAAIIEGISAAAKRPEVANA